MSGEPDLTILLEFPASTLRELAQSMRGGALRNGVSSGLFQSYFGNKSAQIVRQFKPLMDLGCTSAALAVFVEALAAAQESTESALRMVYPVLSGPAAPGVPVVATPTVVRGLFEEAQSSVLVSSYVFHDAAELLTPLAHRMEMDEDFQTTIITDLSHERKGDEPLPVVANRFRIKFLKYSWSGKRAPDFWHDPRALHEPDRSKSGVMHAKTVVIDDTVAFVTSANFTEAAQARNIEAGILLRHSIHVKTLRAFFEGMMTTGSLVKIA